MIPKFTGRVIGHGRLGRGFVTMNRLDFFAVPWDTFLPLSLPLSSFLSSYPNNRPHPSSQSVASLPKPRPNSTHPAPLTRAIRRPNSFLTYSSSHSGLYPNLPLPFLPHNIHRKLDLNGTRRKPPTGWKPPFGLAISTPPEPNAINFDTTKDKQR